MPTDSRPDPENLSPDEVVAACHRETLLAECTRTLYRNYWAALLGSIVVAAVAVWILWDQLPQDLLVLWGLAVAGVAVLRTLLVAAYRRAQPLPRESYKWACRYSWGALAAGVVWGSAGLGVSLAPDITSQIFICFLLGGMGVAAVATSAIYLPAFFAFTIPTLLPVAINFLAFNSPIHMAMGITALAFLVAVSMTGRNMNTLISDALKLRVENYDLIEDLAAAKREAERASRAKSDFLANMSHELRTPLNAIIGFAEVQVRETFGPLGDPRYQEYARDIRDSGQHLLSLISGILDLSKAEAGRLDLEESLIDLPLLLTEAAHLIHGSSTGRAPIETRIAPGLPHLLGDERKIKQIALNLLSNARKFTPAEGTILLSADTAADGGVVLTVTDTGRGMSEEELQIALTKFGQVNNNPHDINRGAGLGLPLVQTLVSLHDGVFTLTSEPGQGTTATITFPPDRSIHDQTAET